MTDVAQIVAGLTKRDCEVLHDLHWSTRECTYARTWVRPLDLGGSGHNDVSYRLNKLAARGVVEWKQRWGTEVGGTARAAGMSRGSKEYRPTPLGLAVRTALLSKEGESADA